MKWRAAISGFNLVHNLSISYFRNVFLAVDLFGPIAYALHAPGARASSENARRSTVAPDEMRIQSRAGRRVLLRCEIPE